MKVQDYFKKELEKKYPDKESLIDQIACNILLKLMIEDYEENKKDYKMMANKELYELLLQKAESKAVQKNDDGSKTYKKPLDNYNPVTESFYTLLTSKESNLTFSNKLTNDPQGIGMEEKGMPEITLTMSITDVNGNTDDFTYFDWAVHDACLRLKEIEKNKANTPDQIYRKMYGITDVNRKPSDKVRQAIIDSADLLNSRKVTMDCTEEAKAYAEKYGYDPNIDEYVIRDYMLSYGYHKMKMKGKEAMGFQWHSEAMPLANAIKKGHYVNIEYKYVNIPGLACKVDNKKLTDFLLRRIVMQMRAPNTSRTIPLKTIFEVVTNKLTDKKKTEILNKVKLILDYWKEEQFNLYGIYFVDYEIKRKRNKKTNRLYNYAINIKLEKRKKNKAIKGKK